MGIPYIYLDHTVQGYGLGLGESWRAVRQVSVQATAVDLVQLYLSYGKEDCARVKSKVVLFFGDKVFIIFMVEFTLEQRIFYVCCIGEIPFCKGRRKFQRQFAGVRIPSRSTIHVNKVKRIRLAGRLHVNLTEGGPTLTQSKASALYGTVYL